RRRAWWDRAETQPPSYLPGYAGYRRIVYVQCPSGASATFHFVKRAWKVDARMTGPGWGESAKGIAGDDLRFARQKGRLGFAIGCSLRCARSVEAHISRKIAKTLGLQSTKIAEGSSSP